MQKRQFSKAMNEPHERREFKGHGHMDVIAFEDGLTIGKGVFEPGWRWSADVQPIAGTESCDAAHSGYSLKGTMVIKMDSGEEFRIRAGDAFHIPPGHHAWVEGSETCELIDVGGYADYAKEQPKKKTA